MPDEGMGIEERLAFLRSRADREGIEVGDDVLEYIAGKFGRHHSLKSGLMRVYLEASRTRRDIDLPFAMWVLGDAPRPKGPAAVQVSATPAAEASAAFAGGRPDVPEPEPEEAPELAFVPPATLIGEEPEEAAEDEGEAEDGAGSPEVPAAEEAPAPSPAPAESGGGRLFGAMPWDEAPEADAEARPAAPAAEPAVVWFAPVRTAQKRSLIVRAGQLLERAGLAEAVAEDDLVAVKLHFGERGSTGFVRPVFVREIVARIKAHGGRPFLTDANTLYRGQRANAVDHLTCAIHNGFAYATVEAPVIIADGLDGRDAVDVPIEGGEHFTEVRIGAAAVHADAMVVVSHVKGHEAAGFGGALKNVGMGLGCRSAKQRMHADFRPEVAAEKCTACARCVKWCPVDAIAIGPEHAAVIDHDACWGCGECVAACPEGAIAAQWKTTPEALQEKIAEHAAGALAGKRGKVAFVSFVMSVSPDCDCWSFSDAGVVADIGVLASADPVAIDRAAYDLVTAAAGLAGTRGEGMAPGTDKFLELSGVDGSHVIEHAERLGLGTQEYELRTLD